MDCASMNGFLVHYDASGSTGKKLHLKGRKSVTFGSDSQCTVVLRTQGFKPKHAIMSIQDGKIFLQNLDEEGRMVRVNDQPLAGDPIEVSHRDKINFENCVVLVYETDPNAQQSEPPVNGNTEHTDEAFNGDEEADEEEGAEEGIDEEAEEGIEEGEGEELAEGEGEEEGMEEDGKEALDAADVVEEAEQPRKRRREEATDGDTDAEAEADSERSKSVDGVSVALKVPETAKDETKETLEGATEEDNSRLRHLTLDRVLAEGLVGEGATGNVEIVKDSTGALCFLLRFPNALKSERAKEVAAGLPELSAELEEARKTSRQRGLPPTKRVRQEPTRTHVATRVGSQRTSTSTRSASGANPASGARVLPPNKRLTATSTRQAAGRTATSTGLNARQRVIVGKKKAAAAALNAHKAEEAAISEADLEGDENYEEEGDVSSSTTKKGKGKSKKGSKKHHISAKGTLLWSAEKVLREEKKPMKASEIIAKGREKGYIETDSKGAANSLVGRFSTSIRQDPNSPFIRVASATYGLKEYAHLASYKNYVETSPDQ